MRILRNFVENFLSRRLTRVGINLIIVLLIILLLELTSNVFSNIFSLLYEILRPFIFGAVLAFVFEPFIQVFYKYNRNRNLSVAVVYVVSFFIILVLLSYSIPVFYSHIIELIPSFNQGLFEFQSLVLQYLHLDISQTVDSIQNNVADIFTNESVIDTTIGIFNQVLSTIVGFIIFFIISIYISIYYKRVKYYLYMLSYKIDRKLPRYINAINDSLHKWLVAFFITAVYQGIVTAIMYLAIGNQNFLILGILSGMTSIIPYFGPVAINILGVILSLNLGLDRIIILLALIFIQSNIFGYVVVPRIYSKRINIGIFEILFAILTGNTIFGPLGILISVPAMVIIKTVHDIYTIKSQNRLPQNN